MESISSHLSLDYFPETAVSGAYAPLLRKIIDNLPAGVIVLDAKGNILDHNPVACEMLEDNLNGSKWIDVITRNLTASDLKLDIITLKNTQKIRLATQSLYPFSGQLILMHDMTETCKLQADSMHQQRLLYLGRMAANIAHQIRTPLATAILYVKNLLDAKNNQQVLNEELSHKFLNKTFESLNHIESQIRGMLLFAKGSRIVKNKMSIEKIISILKNANDVSQIKIKCDKELKKQQIICNSDLLLGSIQGCINNAIESEKNHSEVIVDFVNEKNNLFISIKDTGDGIPQDIMNKIFEPFFTTKENGTGLGLSIARLVANAHDGDLAITSNSGSGTTVKFMLPIIE